MKRLLSIALLSATAISASYATETAHNGFYLSGGVGYTLDNTFPDAAAGFSKTNKGYTFAGNAGYEFAINPSFLLGIEAGYINFGKVEYSSILGNFDLTNYALQLLGTARFLAPSGINLFVKGGFAYQDTGSAVDVIGWPVNYADKSAVLPAAAVGIGYQFNQMYNVYLQYEHTFGKDWSDNTSQPSTPMSLDAFTLGFTVKFPQ